jgi:hypothetical protein
MPGTAPIVDVHVACTLDGCDETNDVVLHQPNDAICSDGNTCTGAEHCDVTLGCVNGSGLATDDGNPCTTDVCDPITGVSHQPLPEGTSCGTGNVCDASANCRQGVAFANFAS